MEQKLSKVPFIKWTGSKRKQAPYIVSQFPKEINTYYECFVGGASVLHELLNQISLGNITCKHIVCSDINYDLIALFNLLKGKDTREELFNFYSNLHKQLKERCNYIEGSSISREDVQKMQPLYYEMRQKYNDLIDQNDYGKERSMIFYWITRTSFNGLIRYNPKGHFNAPFHVAGRFGITPEELKSVFNSWTNVMDSFIENGGTIDFICKPYDQVICEARIGDLVYMDPPYENTKGMYFCKGFDPDLFWEMLIKLNDRKVKWLLSYDGFTGKEDRTAEIPHLYKRHEYVEAGHSSFKKLKSKSRGKESRDMVKDSLYINYE